MASAVPAGILGLAGRTGSLAPGLDADIALLDQQFVPQGTVIRGAVAYVRGDAASDGVGAASPAIQGRG
jgi:N-acetylglucosamine-6-phosphate deacetylase